MSETNEDEVKAIGEAVSAKVANMHENADPAVRAALEDHERNKDDLCRKLEAAIINGTAARNGLALAHLREKNLSEECERLKAELDRLRSERSKPVAEPDWHNAAKMYAKCSECPLGLDVRPGDLAPDHTFGGVKDKGQPRCEGVGRPTRAYRPVLDATGNTIRVDEFRLLGEVGATASDKPGEPVAGVVPHEPSYAEACAAESQLQAMVRNGPVVVDWVGNLYDPNRCTARGPKTGGRCGAGRNTPHDQHYAPGTSEMWAVEGTGRPQAETRIEALEARLNGMAMSDVALEKGLDKSDARLAVLEKRLADVEGRCVARLDRLSEWQSHDAKAAADAIEALATRLAGMEARLTVGERIDSLTASVEGLAERVKALEGGAKAKTNERLYRVRSEGGGAAAGVREGSRFFECTRFRSVADSNRLALQGAGVPKCWLEMSEDNGCTWKRCEENEHA